MILLTDARHRVEGIPGLTRLEARLGGEGEAGLRLNVGSYWLRSQDLRGHDRNPRHASPGSTTKVETVHPPVELSGTRGTPRMTIILQPAPANSHSLPRADRSHARISPRGPLPRQHLPARPHGCDNQPAIDGWLSQSCERFPHCPRNALAETRHIGHHPRGRRCAAAGGRERAVR